MAASSEKSLKSLLRELAEIRPVDRITLRDAVLAHGTECVGPLADLARAQPELSASIAAWLGTLVERDPTTSDLVRPALRRIAATAEGAIARDTLTRVWGGTAGSDPPRVKSATVKPPSASQKFLEVRARVIQAAKEGRVIHYADLETSRGFYGRYLGQLSRDEFEAGHPPISAIVVRKGPERPGPGFYPFMREIGFANRGESDEDIWHRAVAAVHDFWREQT